MKGSVMAIPTYLYVIIAIVVAIIMFTLVSRYSTVFFPENETISVSGDKEEILKILSKNLDECWEEHRKGLDDESDVCKEIEFIENLKIKEVELNEFLDCDKLPNNNCYPDVCDCSSRYYSDVDKIFWFAEPENTELKITYSGDLRKMLVVGYPCDPLCMCINECKEYCFKNEQVCMNTQYFSDCKLKCENPTKTTTTTTLLQLDCYVHFSGLLMSGKVLYISNDPNLPDTSKAYLIDEYSDLVPGGEYSSVRSLLPNTIGYTFDGIAISESTRIIVYQNENFEGDVLLDVTGPAVISNILGYQISQIYSV